MLESYYKSGEKQAELMNYLYSWIDTPFRHHCSVKKEGVDCIRFVAKILEETGVKRKINIPDYPRDWHMHTNDSSLVFGLVQRIPCFNVWSIDRFEQPINGDILLYKSGKAVSHAGIYFDEYVFQSLYPAGVIRKKYNDQKWFPQLRFCFRIIKEVL